MKKMKKPLAALLAMLLTVSLAACGDKTEQPDSPNPSESSNPGTSADGSDNTVAADTYTYLDGVSVLASNWNPHIYETADDGYPLSFITSSLYDYIFNDVNHPVDGKEPFDGYVVVPEMAADYPVDVTEAVKAAHPEFNIPESATSGFAWSVKLRDDLKWDDGTPITAEDFVESFKRLLDPKYLNYRASDYYDGSYAVVNAINYSLAGKYSWNEDAALGIQLDEMTKNDDGEYMYGDKHVRIALDYGLSAYLDGDTLKDYVDAYGDAYFGLDTYEDLLALMDDDGLVPCTDESLALLSGVTTTNPEWQETDEDLYNYLLIEDQHYEEDFPFENVGLYVSGDNELTFVYRNALDGFYLMIYGMDTNYLVKTDLYDSCLTPTETAKGTVYTNTYATSVATSPSYGPYKMDSFQTDKAMHFVKNENWYGWTDGNHTYVDPVDGQTYEMYMTTAIDTQVVTEAATRKQMFLAGQIMTYGLQAEDFDQYINSEFCYKTPAETVFMLLFNGYESVIAERESAADFDKATIDLEMQTNNTFRRAMAVSIDRELFAATVSPARTGGYGFIGGTYIYDPETAAYYRDTDQAKKALCNFYSINLDNFGGDLDAAVASITGYDPVTAAELFTQAYNEGIEAGYITDADGDGICDQTITMYYALGSDGEFYDKTLKFLNESIDKATEGTPLYQKIRIVKTAPLGNTWSATIRQGIYDTQLAGWRGNVLDPFGLTDTWTRTEDAYWGRWWDANAYDMTVNINGTDVTMSIRAFAECLNGNTKTVNGVDYNLGYGQVDVEVRLDVLAAIEEQMLLSYNAVPLLQDAGASLLSQQVYYVVEDYNPMMGRGGIAYMKYNYSDAEWADYVASQGGTLQY